MRSPHVRVGRSLAPGVSTQLRSFRLPLILVCIGSQPCALLPPRRVPDSWPGDGQHYPFSSPGARVITLTAKDSNGAPASESVSITVTDDAPSVWIVKPTPMQSLYRDYPFVFQGTSSDLNELFFKLPCSSLKWTSSNPSDQLSGALPKQGCTPEVTFPSTGTRTITNPLPAHHFFLRPAENFRGAVFQDQLPQAL